MKLNNYMIYLNRKILKASYDSCVNKGRKLNIVEKVEHY